MAPINLPDGTEVSEVILPDGSTASEVIAPDGSTVFGNAIPDPTAEYIADDITGSNGDSVASWDPSTGSISLTDQNNASQQPTLETDTLNNNNVLVGDGTDDHLVASQSILNNEEMTAYIVAEPSRDSNQGYVLGNGIGSGTDTNPSITTRFNQPWEYLDGSGTLNTISLTDDGYAIIGFIRSKSDDNVIVRYNGTTPINTTFSASPSTDYVPVAFADDDATPANSGIAHIYTKNRPLTQDEYTNLESELSNRYNITT